MKNKKLITTILAVALIGAVGIGSTLAYFTDNDSKYNTVTMGHVDITLTEETNEPDGTYDKYDNGIDYHSVMPGQTISKIPTIAVNENSQDTYVRAKVEVTGMDDAELKAYKDELVESLKNTITETDEGASTGWYYGVDGYFYYNEKLTANDTVNIFEKVVIPTSWDNKMADGQFDIKIKAEAIQADFFDVYKIEGNSENPAKIVTWGDDVTEETIQEYTKSQTPMPVL